MLTLQKVTAPPTKLINWTIDLFILEALEFISSRFLSGVHSSATTEHSSIDPNSKCSSLHTVLSIIQLTVLQQSDYSKEIISLLF